MANAWDEARIQRYIDDEIEESLNLDYKAADALAKTDGKRKEVTKDVSAMANSDGGVIVYGLSEDPNNRHLPGRFDLVNRNDFSKEWLEQVISNIRPKIDGLLIHPVPIGNSKTDAVYVVEIPKSHTAHQAMDKRYYKRFNFQSVMMDDHEVREGMNRGQHPRIELEFEIIRCRSVRFDEGTCQETEPFYRLQAFATNRGSVRANHTNIQIYLPPRIESNMLSASSDAATAYTDPVFPGRRELVLSILLRADYYKISLHDIFLSWIVSADDAPVSEGRLAMSEIQVQDRPVEIRSVPMSVDWAD